MYNWSFLDIIQVKAAIYRVTKLESSGVHSRSEVSGYLAVHVLHVYMYGCILVENRSILSEWFVFLIWREGSIEFRARVGTVLLTNSVCGRWCELKKVNVIIIDDGCAINWSCGKDSVGGVGPICSYSEASMKMIVWICALSWKNIIVNIVPGSCSIR